MSSLDTLNITDSDLTYDQLVDYISDIVLETQNHKEYRVLPHILKMTKKQHKMLRRYPQCKAMFGTIQKHWLTPHNIMEVEVVEPDKH